MRRLVRTASWQNQEWPISPAKSDGSGITAISGSTPGSGTVTLYGFDGSSLSSRALDVTCYNMAGAVDADTWLLVTQDIFGRWWVVVENC